MPQCFNESVLTEGSALNVGSSDPDTLRTAVVDQPALEAWGRAVGEAVAAGEVRPPLVAVLRGPLGAGKSVLARAVARGAGVRGPMPSPTYNLLFSYDAGAGGADADDGGDRGDDHGLRVLHLDLYRLEHPDDVWELGWQELGEGRQVVLVEWPDRAEELLPPDRWEVTLSFPAGDGDGAASLRRLEVRRLGSAPDVPPLPEDAATGDATAGDNAGTEGTGDAGNAGAGNAGAGP